MNQSVESRSSDSLTRRIVQVCDASGDFIEYWGFKAIHGRVWTLLALRGEPMAQTRIAQTLGVSRSLMSSAISELTELGLVRATTPHRNAPYEAVMDIWPVIGDVLRRREWMLIEGARVALEAALEQAEVNTHSGEPVHWNTQRMQTLLRMTESAQAFLRILMSLRLPSSIKEVSSWVPRFAAVVGGFRRSL